VTVADGALTTLDRTYTSNGPTIGSLQIFIAPPAVITLGASGPRMEE